MRRLLNRAGLVRNPGSGTRAMRAGRGVASRTGRMFNAAGRLSAAAGGSGG